MSFAPPAPQPSIHCPAHVVRYLSTAGPKIFKHRQIAKPGASGPGTRAGPVSHITDTQQVYPNLPGLQYAADASPGVVTIILTRTDTALEMSAG